MRIWIHIEEVYNEFTRKERQTSPKEDCEGDYEPLDTEVVKSPVLLLKGVTYKGITFSGTSPLGIEGFAMTIVGVTGELVNSTSKGVE